MKTKIYFILILTVPTSYAYSQAKDMEACIFEEPVEMRGSFETEGYKEGFFNRGYIAHNEKQAQMTCRSILQWNSHPEGITHSTNDRSVVMGDWVDYENFDCKLQKTEIPGTARKEFVRYKYDYIIKATKTHTPNVDTVKKKRIVKLKGSKIEGSFPLSYSSRVSEEDSLNGLKASCKNAGGSLVDVRTQDQGTNFYFPEIDGPIKYYNTWRSEGKCKGSFFYYGEEDRHDVAEAKCEEEEKSKLGNFNSKVSCRYFSDMEYIPKISQKSEIQLSFAVFHQLSFKEQDNSDLYKKWKCDRFARCQVKGDKTASNEIRESYKKLCDFSHNTAMSIIFGEKAKSPEESGAINQDSQIKEINSSDRNSSKKSSSKATAQ